MEAKKNSECRYCSSKNLWPFLSLGNHPPADAFLTSEQAKVEKKYPLEVYLCKDCSLVQLLWVVPPQVLFSNFIYLSSSSGMLRKHYGELTQSLIKDFNLKANDVVVDIGCNDGIMLNAYEMPELQTVGVDPAKVCEVAKSAGHYVINDFFSPPAVEQIKKEKGSAKIITATNVFPHVDPIGELTDCVASLLSDDGVFVIEASYLPDLIDQTLFDTIYHEHLCYLSLTPMIPFFKNHGLEIFRAEREPVGASGPAIRVYAQKLGGPHAQTAGLKTLLEEEKTWGVNDPKRYEDFATRVFEIKKKTLSMISEIKSQGKTIAGFGAPAKGNTLLNFLEIDSDTIEYLAETNELKQDKLAPGSHIPIISEGLFIERKPDYALLLPWNYLNFFLEKSDYIKNGGKFLVPLPEPKILP